ncbi:heparinase II/III family protein, partial [Geminisphaera colitermitum]|uniref:heparinase II/III family protein n=1 Tax=Geminisphaera colitermitum TaxID=1148786 RepID=UPI001E2A2589
MSNASRKLSRILCLLVTTLWPLTSANANDNAPADAALLDTYTLQGITATQPRLSNGGYDWDWRGPNKDPEWAWFFNRHAIFQNLLDAYRKTGDTRYRDHLLATLNDWIAAHPPPRAISFSAAWRPLEAARRVMESWIPTWRQLRDDPAAFPPERRARFLQSLHDHGNHLRHHHAFAGNHLITEMLALAELSLTLPDLPDALEWRDYALTRLARAYDEQVYPDGAHKELSTHYQRVVALNYQQLLTLLRTSGQTDLARAWEPRVRRLWEYFAAVMKPDGTNPLNNDSDTEAVATLLRAYSPDTLPPTHSTHLPYAGQTIFRSRLSPLHLWAFFDTGPRGTDHDHADRLHFSLSIDRNDFLVDNGRYTYTPGPFRDYFAGPSAHNVVLLN